MPFHKTFDYKTVLDVSEGDILSLPFGKTSTFGVVLKVEELPCNPEFALKEAKEVVLKNAISGGLLYFIKEAARYNCGFEGMFLRLCFPFSRFNVQNLNREKFDLEILPGSEVNEKFSKSRLWKELNRKFEKGESVMLSKFDIPPSKIKEFVEKSLISLKKHPLSKPSLKLNLPKLSSLQEEALNFIKLKLDRGFTCCLLEGETGSGKTEVYFYAIKEVILKGGQVLLMLPEIALSSSIMERFEKRFGFRATLWHSSVSEKQKVKAYLDIVEGKENIIIGTRSALFLPFKNLKLIIVDEEHDSSYKQEENIIYNGRDMAVLRGFIFKIPVILGSATPSIESFNNAQNGKYNHIFLKNRFFVGQMPKMEIVDMKVFKKQNVISEAVISKMLQVLKEGGQVMLFLNRRGYAPIIFCSSCGEKIKCKFCDVHLTEHRAEKLLKCHHCGYTVEMPKECEACGAKNAFRIIGAGVERVKEQVEKLLSPSEVVLLTSDTLTSPAKTAHIINEIEAGRAKVIIGTQVISKGYHFKNLRFVAILDADFGLNIEDFRAFEKTFHLLYQVAGRTGRETADGEVYLQTLDPKNKVLFSIVNYDKKGFYSLEIETRKKFYLPPFSKQVGFVILSEKKEEALSFARTLAISLEEEFKDASGLSIFGPSTPIISFLRNKFRFRILLMSSSRLRVQERILKVMQSLKLPSSVFVKIDVDPITFY